MISFYLIVFCNKNGELEENKIRIGISWDNLVNFIVCNYVAGLFNDYIERDPEFPFYAILIMGIEGINWYLNGIGLKFLWTISAYYEIVFRFLRNL